MTAKTVDFLFDVGSPAAYLAWTQLPKLAQETGAQVRSIPVLLGGVFQATGNRSPVEVPAKGRYMNDDLKRFAKRYGVEFQHNPHFPINTLMLMRGATGLALRDPSRYDAYIAAVMRAIWVDSENMNDPQVVGRVLAQAGFDPQSLLALTQDPEVKDALKQATQNAVERGMFGAPTFYVGDQMFWGQDRIEFVKEALQ